MSGEDFEEKIAIWLRKQGFRTELTPRTNDRGIDIIAKRNRNIFAVQAKNHAEGNKVGSPTIQKASGLLSRADIDGAVVITTSSFTSEAIKVAKNRGVELIPVEPYQSEQDPRQRRKSSSSRNEEYIYDSRIKWHQEEAGISRVDEDGQNAETEPHATLNCPTCQKEISGSTSRFISHWKDCDLPDSRPSDISVDTWWEIKDEVR